MWFFKYHNFYTFLQFLFDKELFSKVFKFLVVGGSVSYFTNMRFYYDRI